MLRRLWQAVRPAILWSYRRGSWQYDLIVAAILAFIFLVPRDFFRDQPRPPSVQQIEVASGEKEALVFLVDSSVINGKPEKEVAASVAGLLRQRTGKDLQVIDMRPTADAEGEVTGYLIYARP